jgi:hypothetical protein
MIQEAYCSFEVAKLLKEKGFNSPCQRVYDKNGIICIIYSGFDIPHNYTNILLYLCPTHQMAMAWLREVHNIGIFPSTYTHISDRKTIHSHGTAIINLKTYELMTDSYLANDTYEEAVEVALKYTLENLI